MKIVFLAVDDEFAGSMQRYLYEKHPEWVVGSVLSTRPLYKRSKLGAAFFVLRQSGFIYAAEMFKMKIIRKTMQKDEKTTPLRLAQKYKVDIFYSENINNDESLSRLASWSPDLIISTNFSHYVGDRVCRIARLGAWNLHKSLLPQYRGMAPSFYALLHDAKKVGVTLHKIARGFDTGDIIKQIEVPIDSDDSVYTLNRKTSDAGGRMMAQLLDTEDPNKIVATPQPAGDWPNYTYPNKKDVKAFLKKGCRF